MLTAEYFFAGRKVKGGNHPGASRHPSTEGNRVKGDHPAAFRRHPSGGGEVAGAAKLFT